MGRLLRFVAFAALLVALLVFVVLPAVASPVLTQAVRDMGVQADDLKVTVDTFDPALLSGQAARLRVEGRNVRVGRAQVGRLDLTLFNVSIFDRTFDSLSGRLEDVSVTAGGISAEVESVDINGPANEARATGHFDPEQSAQLVRDAAERNGVTLDEVSLGDGRLRLRIGQLEADAGIAVEGGALTLRPQVGPTVLLLQPAPSDPWRLIDAYVSVGGVTVLGVVDALRVVDSSPGGAAPSTSP